MSPGGSGAVALTLGFTSLRSHPVPSLRWGCENTIKYFFLASFSAPWCHLSDGCNLTHDYGYVYCSKQYRKKQKKENTLVSIYLYGVAFPSKRIFFSQNRDIFSSPSVKAVKAVWQGVCLDGVRQGVKAASLDMLALRGSSKTPLYENTPEAQQHSSVPGI